MKILIQRVLNASVSVDTTTNGSIAKGLVVFLGFAKGDDENKAFKAIDKILKLRIFSDESDRLNLSLMDVAGSLLLVSQFTLCASFKSGNRPGFDQAMVPTEAKELYDRTVAYAKKLLGNRVATGVFGADMKVQLVNDGPCTFMMEF